MAIPLHFLPPLPPIKISFFGNSIHFFIILHQLSKFPFMVILLHFLDKPSKFPFLVSYTIHLSNWECSVHSWESTCKNVLSEPGEHLHQTCYQSPRNNDLTQLSVFLLNIWPTTNVWISDIGCADRQSGIRFFHVVGVCSCVDLHSARGQPR